MKTGAKLHPHKYRKLSSGVWACALADCSHYMPLNLIENMDGKRSVCWQCNQTFILSEQSLKMDKPMCNNCIAKFNAINIGINPEAIESIEELTERKLREINKNNQDGKKNMKFDDILNKSNNEDDGSLI